MNRLLGKLVIRLFWNSLISSFKGNLRSTLKTQTLLPKTKVQSRRHDGFPKARQGGFPDVHYLNSLLGNLIILVHISSAQTHRCQKRPPGFPKLVQKVFGQKCGTIIQISQVCFSFNNTSKFEVRFNLVDLRNNQKLDLDSEIVRPKFWT